MKRSKFALSYTNLLSCDLGELIPCGITEVLPGDTVQHATSVLLRASPLLAPVMHPVDVRVHHFFIPYRIIWEDFEKFITGGPDGMDASVYPTISFNNVSVGALADYLGVPTSVASARSVSALPFRAYALVWNEFFRDQDLQSALTIDLTSGADTTTSVSLQNCAWEKDYFTSSRPWEQKGPSITIPIGNTAPVVGNFDFIQFAPSHGGADSVLRSTGTAAGTASMYTDPQIAAGSATWFGTQTGLETDLTGASAVTVTALREALALQRYEEARARFGSRYTEYLRYLGVRSSDARLQRPEYLGGGRQVIQFSEVLQSAEGTDPVGTLRGHGIAAARSNRYRRFFEEHGVVLSLMSVRPKTIYMQGLSRMWNRRTKEDFWQQELQHVGQQEVLNKEIYMASPTPDGIFGYQDRYDEYRRNESRVSGEFRTSTLNFWHFAREFGGAPALNGDFVKCVPTERTFAVPSTDVLWCMVKHSMQARRLVSGSSKSFIY